MLPSAVDRCEVLGLLVVVVSSPPSPNMMTHVDDTPLVEADASRPKWFSRVDPQSSRLDDLTSLNFSKLRLFSAVFAVEAGIAYALFENIVKPFQLVSKVNGLGCYPSIAAWFGIGVLALVFAVFVALAVFAAWMYTVARMRTPSTGEPSKFLTFNKSGLQAKWEGKPIPVEVRGCVSRLLLWVPPVCMHAAAESRLSCFN